MSHQTDCELCCINNLINQYVETQSNVVLSILELYFIQHQEDINKYIVAIYEV